ncbi:hypothetical protein [Fodinicola acaciae]|uniref:hypothetical protein n=1 Tax=Fodinicola acaciae TaxID=2681555 RepID=UPI0013D4A20A|nr:hypothetical protein [Fodinicola acaciae]
MSNIARHWLLVAVAFVAVAVAALTLTAVVSIATHPVVSTHAAVSNLGITDGAGWGVAPNNDGAGWG